MYEPQADAERGALKNAPSARSSTAPTALPDLHQRS